MYLTILALPIIGAIISGLRGRSIGVTGAQIITTSCVIASALLTLVAFYEVGLSSSPVSIVIGPWIDSEFLFVNWGFLFDSLTISILLAVLGVSSIVHLFSISYIANDPHNQRFFAYLSMFTFSMLILVTGDNYFVIFVGWEAIGISSYLLINFWFTRIEANKSGIKGLTINRVGDMFLSIGFFGILWSFGNLDYATVFSISPYINEGSITIIGVLLLIGAIAKSANVPLHTWLPFAIEGPTPVSALIHAATLVTAGVYLILRSSPILEYGPTALVIITWTGAITAFFAATTGLVQNDLKRIIAYSTCSQIGYLMMAVGLSQYNVALFHLVNHAFFKALLFIGAGVIIHGMADQQDVRRLGGLVNFMPFTYVAITIGSMSLMAIPFITGFYSKDLILEVALGQYEIIGTIVYWIGTISAIFTAFYSYRLIALTFFSVPNAPKNDYVHAHEASTIIIVPLVILSIMAIFFGYIAKDLYVGPGTDFLSTALYQLPDNVYLIEAEFGIPILLKHMPAILTLFGAFLAMYIYHVTYDFEFNSIGYKIYNFLNAKWYFDALINGLIINNTLIGGLTLFKVIDRGIIEEIGPYGISNKLVNLSQIISKYDSGIITSYALYIMLGLISLILFVFGAIYINDIITLSIIIIYIGSLILIP